MAYIPYVSKMDTATLLPIIERVVVPGSIIILDEWAAYRGIANTLENYTHLTVNQSEFRESGNWNPHYEPRIWSKATWKSSCRWNV